MNAARNCEKTRDSLTRFLDNELPGREATEVTAHLEACADCRREYDQFKQMKETLRALPLPSAQNAETARLRAFARLESAVHAETSLPPARSAWRWPAALRGWQPAVATVAAAALVGVFFMLPNASEVEETPALNGTAVTAPLPGASELSELYALHDVHGGPLTEDDMLLRRSETADAHAALLDHADATVAGSL
jgi:anti-sigma factor RsiW